MKVRVSFSVFTSNGEVVGQVDGQLECAVEPMLDDKICLMLAPDGTPIPPGHPFGALFKVTDRIITPNKSDVFISMILEDMIIDKRDQAITIMRYFESGYGLFSTVYSDSGS